MEEEALLKVKSDGLSLLSFRPRSVEELCDRLRKKGHAEDAIAQAVEFFKKQGLLDDRKFAKVAAHSSLYSNPSGRRKLEADLKKKGVPQDVIKGTLDDLKDYDEKAVAFEAAKKRLETMKGIAPLKQKSRLYGFLARRGFSNDAVYGALNKLFKGGNEEQ